MNSVQITQTEAQILHSLRDEMARQQEALAEHLRELRVDKRWTQEVAAAEIGVSLRTYQGWEKGERVPRLRNLDAICNAFGIPVSSIVDTAPMMFGEGPNSNDSDRLAALERTVEHLDHKLDRVLAIVERLVARRAEDEADAVESEARQHRRSAEEGGGADLPPPAR